MKNVYIATIKKTNGVARPILAYCLFDSKKKAIEWITNQHNLLAEDLYLLEGMNHILWATASTRERNRGHVSRKKYYDYIDSFAKYRVSTLSRHTFTATDEFAYRVYTVEIGKTQENIECDSDFGKPVIDIERVEQKLDAYKKEREGLARKSKKGETL